MKKSETPQNGQPKSAEGEGEVQPTVIVDLSSLLTEQKEFGTLVKSAIDSKDNEAPRVDLLFVRFRESTPDEDGLAEILCSQVMNYSIPRKKMMEIHRQSAAKPGDGSMWSKLESEAKRAFIAFNSNTKNNKPEARYSEVGEMIAFCVASHYLGAGQVAAKMALKTSGEMPGYGLDGIHVKSESNGHLTIFFLEAKMVGTAKAGAAQYAESAGKFDGDRKNKLNEQRIARDLSNLDILDSAMKEAALDYFNPYSEEQSSVRERFVGVIVFTDKSFETGIEVTDATPIEAYQKHFVKGYKSRHAEITEDLKTALTSKAATHGRCRAFFLAVPDVDNLKKLFARGMSNGHVR